MAARAVAIARGIACAAVRTAARLIRSNRHEGWRLRASPQTFPPCLMRLSKHRTASILGGCKTGGCDATCTLGHREVVRQAERLPRLSLKPTGLADGFGEGVTYSTNGGDTPQCVGPPFRSRGFGRPNVSHPSPGSRQSHVKFPPHGSANCARASPPKRASLRHLARSPNDFLLRKTLAHHSNVKS